MLSYINEELSRDLLNDGYLKKIIKIRITPFGFYEPVRTYEKRKKYLVFSVPLYKTLRKSTKID